jgi:methionyl-tRNA formyltransferase
VRIVFFGTPAFAVPTLRALLASRHEVVAVVSQPDRPRGRGHKLQPTPTRVAAEEAGTSVLQPERIRDEAFLRALADLAPDLGVVAAYGKILPERLLGLPRLGMINVHASLLPAYRGAAPVHRAVMNGETETGVTIMRVVRELDAGPMMAMTRRPIGPDETSVEVERALADLGAPLLLEVVDALERGTAREIPQDDSQATYAAKIERSEGAVDWTLPARRVHDRVRGLQPWPLVSTLLDGRRYLLHRTVVTGAHDDRAPGTIVEASGDRFEAVCGDGGVLRILTIQPEGRRMMTAREFLTGYRIEPGARFTPP